MLARIIEKSINNILTTLSISIFSIVPTHVETVVLLSRKKAGRYSEAGEGDIMGSTN